MTLLRVALVSFVVASLVGCGDKSPRPRGDSGTGPVDGSTDSGSANDGSVEADGNVPSDSGSDAGDVDAGDADADMPDGSVADGGTMCPGVPVPCSGGCASGERCITSMCGASICAPSGSPCETDADCHPDSMCSNAVCVPSSAGVICNDSRDCAAGHVCEGTPGDRDCIARRIPCPVDEACPLGFVCTTPGSGEGAFCAYIHRLCDDGKVCPVATSDGCLDVDGDGETECAPPMGQCNRNADCATGACIFDATGGFGGTCSPAGLCQVGGSGCGSGLSCADLRGEGPGQCVSSGCVSDDDCGDHGVCAVASGATVATCFDGL